MTPRFLAFIPLLLDLEIARNADGSVHTEHDPDDPGGATKYGIDQRSHPGVDIAALTQDQATAIYFGEWTAAPVEALPPRLGELLFDIRVNGGPGAAWLQQALNVIADGFTGPQTLAAAQSLDAAGIAKAVQQVCAYRDMRFVRLAGTNPRFEKYLNGWLNRSARVRAFCLAPLDDDSSWA